MRLTKFLQFIGISTILCLTYVHLQMKIIDMAYKGKEREKEIRQLIEENGSVTYAILTLKSSSHLGHAMLSDQARMRFADAENVIRVNTDAAVFEDEVATSKQTEVSGKRSIFDIIPFGRTAEARPHR